MKKLDRPLPEGYSPLWLEWRNPWTPPNLLRENARYYEMTSDIRSDLALGTHPPMLGFDLVCYYAYPALH